MIDDESAPEEHDDISEGTFVFLGEKLPYRFSFERQAVAQCFGDNSAAENDLMIVFLCTLDSDEINILRARGASAFRKQMNTFAEKVGYSIHSKNQARIEARRVADAIFSDLAKASFVPDVKKGAASPKAIG